MKKYILVLLTIFLPFSSLFATTIIGKVVDVHDGDTITVESSNHYYKVRLKGIDTPETSRNAKFKKDISKVYESGSYNIFIKIPPSELLRIGENAKWELRNLTLGKVVKVEIDGVDRYKRNLGWVWLENILVNEYMVSKGLARPYMLSGRYSQRILQAESKAKKSKLGIYRY